MFLRFRSSVFVLVGFMLSPLSWWNDPVVNVPLAYLFSAPFVLISEKLFVPTFILGYWLTNLAGLLLMHQGFAGMANAERRQRHWVRDVVVSVVYTFLILLLVLCGWLKPPTAYLK